MSRSYKKCPGVYAVDTFMKHYANRVVRYKKDIPNGSAYKNYIDRWDVIDYNWRIYNSEWIIGDYKYRRK